MPVASIARSVQHGLLFLSCIVLTNSTRADYRSTNQHAVFNGSSYISVPNSTSLNQSLSGIGEISIDAWVYPTSFANSPVVVGNDRSTSYSLEFTPAGKIRFYIGSGISALSNASVPLNQWTHIAVSYSYLAIPDQFHIYINNALDFSGYVTTIPIGTTSGDLRIGADRSGGSPSNHFSGRIDEVRIWKKVIDFPAAEGALYRIPLRYGAGRYGRFLVSSWRLNGDGIDPVSSNNGSIVGSVTFSGTNNPDHYSRICASLKNDGASGHDFFNIPSSSSVSPPGSFTLEAWVYPTSGGASATFQTIAIKGWQVGGGNFMYWLGLNKSNGKLRFAPNSVWAEAMESSAPIPSNQWTHVAATFLVSGGTRTGSLFINGVPAGSASYNSSATPNIEHLYIGTSDFLADPASGYAFTGRIDELRIWTAARSAEEIANAYRLEIDGSTTNLGAVFHFDGDILDHSGNDNHGFNGTFNSAGLVYLDASSLPEFPYLSLVTPNGGETWGVGSSRPIGWIASGIGTVQLLLSRNGGATFDETIVPSIAANAGIYNWQVTGPATSQARVLVVTATPTGLGDASDAVFEITSVPSVTIQAPNGGESWQVGTVQQITWNAFAIGDIRIELSRDGGASFPETIAASVPSGIGTYAWTVDGLPTTQARIRITTTAPSGPADTSNADFTITTGPSLSLLTPNGGEAWIATTLSQIVWNASGIGDIRLELSRDGGLTFPETLAPSLPASSGQYFWTVSGPATTGARIRISSVTPAGYADTSDADFSISVLPPVSTVVVTVLLDGAGLGGIPVSVDGDTSLASITDNSGNCVFILLNQGTYTFRPESPYYTFGGGGITISPLVDNRALIFHATPKNGSFMFRYHAGWNLVSLPLVPVTGNVPILFRDAVPTIAYRFVPGTGYVADTAMQFGVGYWIRFSKADSVQLTGSFQGRSTVQLNGKDGGWNLIGGGSGIVPIGSITQIPSSSLISAYQYDPGSGTGYHLPPGDLLVPGRGYFVKVRTDATWTLPSSFTGIPPSDDASLPPSSLPDILHPPPPPGYGQ